MLRKYIPLGNWAPPGSPVSSCWAASFWKHPDWWSGSSLGPSLCWRRIWRSNLTRAPVSDWRRHWVEPWPHCWTRMWAWLSWGGSWGAGMESAPLCLRIETGRSLCADIIDMGGSWCIPACPRPLASNLGRCGSKRAPQAARGCGRLQDSWSDMQGTSLARLAHQKRRI